MHSIYKNTISKYIANKYTANTALVLTLLLCGTVNVHAQGTLLIKVRFNGDIYSVVNVKHLEQTLPPFKNNGEDSQDILFNMSDEIYEILSQGRISNPATLHGVLTANAQGGTQVGAEDGVNNSAHETHTLQQGVFMLRLPHKEGMRFLHLYKKTMNTARSKARSSLNTQQVQRFDLYQYSP